MATGSVPPRRIVFLLLLKKRLKLQMLLLVLMLMLIAQPNDGGFEPVTPPSIQVTNTTVKDLMSIFLTCLSNDTGISIHWLFNSQRLRITNKMMLSPNNSTLQIDPARSENSGDYQCEVTKGLVNKRSDRITLNIKALLLTFWNFATTAELTVEAVPPHAGEGDNVLFLAHNVPETQRFFNWFRGNRLNMSNSIIRLITYRSKIEKGPLYSERETIYTDGSLLFKNVTKKDAGVYLLIVTVEDLDEKKATLQLYVHDPVTPPSIQVTNTTVKDLMSIFLTCLSNDTGISIHWLFNSQRLRITNKMMLSPNNSTLQIDPARSENSGDYQCEVTKGLVNKRSDRITLNIKGEPPKPKKHRPSLRGIIGIVAQCLMGLIAVIFVLVFLWRSRRGR
ncbi:carcinoembryonic antigen-related cell adhesion molecule 21-like [Peromyscus californicus insignis]|uniref:carcinoembryonic antigen-related cell adhesion molecule 21-like n=1 Tax=Peromyscus californicus insignis TaxID=564181 RepID=UPI0022A7209F|nr:carcinoembryonic antigen-related cell adhesion molecule 21-like [Peromyscus californicus insignis]